MADDNSNHEAAQRQNRKIMRSSTLISLVGAALFLISGALIYKLMPSPFEQQVNANNAPQVESRLSIDMVQKNTAGQWVKLDSIPASGEEVSFRISSTTPLHATLISEPSRSHPRTLFDDIRIPPGENKIVNFGDKAYRYTIKAYDQQARFCLITAADTVLLAEKLMAMQKKASRDTIPDQNCVNW